MRYKPLHRTHLNSTRDTSIYFVPLLSNSRNKMIARGHRFLINNRPPRLSREEIVRIITDFYTFLTKMYIPESALKFPPRGGWPNITLESTKNFGKEPIVIDVMKHLPYIDDKDARDFVTNIHYKCEVVDYSKLRPEDFTKGFSKCGEMFLEWRWERERERGQGGGVADDEEKDQEGDEQEEEDQEQEGDEEEDESDEQLDDEEWWDRNDLDEDSPLELMFVLAEGYESYGRNLVLDVFKGVIHEDLIRANDLGSSPVENFFSNLKEKLVRLENVPVPRGLKYEGELYEGVPEIEEDEVLRDPMERLLEPLPIGSDIDSAVWERARPWFQNDRKWFKKIYRDHGWPNLEQYRKEEALAEIRRYTDAAGLWY